MFQLQLLVREGRLQFVPSLEEVQGAVLGMVEAVLQAGGVFEDLAAKVCVVVCCGACRARQRADVCAAARTAVDSCVAGSGAGGARNAQCSLAWCCVHIMWHAQAKNPCADAVLPGLAANDAAVQRTRAAIASILQAGLAGPLALQECLADLQHQLDAAGDAQQSTLVDAWAAGGHSIQETAAEIQRLKHVCLQVLCGCMHEAGTVPRGVCTSQCHHARTLASA
jgi:hypothetical protein